MEMTTHTPKGVNKTSRYGWVTKDEPGAMRMLHKDVLQIHPAYQRDVMQDKVKAITSSWSWLSLGALVVGERDGEFWVIDGQHRALAAKRRSDITMLPCVIFQTQDVKTEARGFLDLNTGRKPVTAIAKQKAMVAAGDDVATYVNQVFQDLGLEVKSTPTSGQLKCVAWCFRKAAENKDRFRTVLAIGAELSAQDGVHVAERLLDGLWVLDTKYEGGLTDKRLVKRLREKGAKLLLQSANRAAAYYASGGGKVWAQGMLGELNKGLRIKFTIDGVES